MIDLRSDTVTKPSGKMREAARDAEVADDKRDGDPSVRELESLVAERLGVESAVFVPSGTMANQIAIRAQTSPGDEIIVDRLAHVYTSEYAGLAQLSQLHVRPIDAGARACPRPEEVRAAVQERTQWPGTGLLSLENTHNKRGGIAIDPEDITAAGEAAHEIGIPVHLDGARLANAAVVLDQPLDSFTTEVDTVMFDLSKGLGAPVGAVLAGREDVIERARNYRFVFGGGMRQAGIIAAPGVVSLSNIERLAIDHENAAIFAEKLAAGTDVEVQSPETNIVIIHPNPAGMTSTEFLAECENAGVLGGAIDESTVRFCTHLDVTKEMVTTAAEQITEQLAT